MWGIFVYYYQHYLFHCRQRYNGMLSYLEFGRLGLAWPRSDERHG